MDRDEERKGAGVSGFGGEGWVEGAGREWDCVENESRIQMGKRMLRFCLVRRGIDSLMRSKPGLLGAVQA